MDTKKKFPEQSCSDLKYFIYILSFQAIIDKRLQNIFVYFASMNLNLDAGTSQICFRYFSWSLKINF